MPTNLPKLTVRTRINRALTKIAQDPRYQKIANTLNNISGSPKNTNALATINGAPLSQKALNIKQIPPHILLASSTLPDEPAWAATSSGQSNHARSAVKQVVNRAVKHFSKPSKTKTALKAAVAVISGGLAGAGGILIYAAIPFLPYAAAGWLAAGSACLLAVAGVGLYAVVSLLAKNNTKKSFTKLFLDGVKREILAEELLKIGDSKKSGACIKLLSDPLREESLKQLMDNIQTANNIIDRFNNGARDKSMKASNIDKLLEIFRHPDRLLFYESIIQIKSHMEGFGQAARIVSRRESYAAS